MADEIDFANALMEAEVSRALSQLRSDTLKNSIGSKSCAECGDAIPAARQKLGFQRCVSCAAESERKKTLFAD